MKLTQYQQTKTCTRCDVKKIKLFFTRRKRSIDGYNHVCKACRNQDKKKYRKTKKGLITGIYQRQIYSSRERNHTNPEYSKIEFEQWILSQSNFEKLYDNWVNSNYNKNLIPSVDRLNDYKGYSFKNIQLMTWGENKLKSYEDKKNGINNKNSISVSQYDLNNVFIKSFYSINQASRSTSILPQSIHKNCNNTIKTAGGFIWKYN